MIDRRGLLLAGLGAGLGGGPAGRALAEATIDLPLPGGPTTRPYGSFPSKGPMIIQRVHPPLLETPLEAFDAIETPNDRFFVRWHHDFPTGVDVRSYRLAVRGAVARPLRLDLAALLRMPRVELVAVNQCSGNSRGLFQPRVPGAQWANGAMGCARWTGVRLRDVLDRAGVRPGAKAVRFTGRDAPLAPTVPRFRKSLALDHARDDEVMLAFQMNGAQLPLLNGFPLRLVVPGWYSTYWLKMVSDIEVLTAEDDQYWMAKAYRIPTVPVAPGAKDFPTVPINRMVPRSFLTSHRDGERVARGAPLAVGGIAFSGGRGVKRVELSLDGGRSWRAAALGADAGRHAFRRWSATLPPVAGNIALLVRATDGAGETQPMTAGWNPSGFMRNVVERTTLVAA